jgi:glycosyltransferase involved in cell wall biosynthesis
MASFASEILEQQSRPSENALKSPISVFLMDLWSYSPHYDRYLYEGLKQGNIDVKLGSVCPYQDPGYFARNGVRNTPGLLDFVPKLRIRNDEIRRVLMLLECCINMIALLLRFFISRPDIVHVQWIPMIRRTPIEIWFLKLVKGMGSKLVYTVHNVLPHDTGKEFAPLFRSVYQEMDALICHSVGAKNQLVGEFSLDPARVCVIPHGPLPHDGKQLSSEEAKRVLGAPTDKVLVLWQGIVRPYKGLDFLLQAWRQIDATRMKACLLLAGSGSPEALQALREQVEALGLRESVVLDLRYLADDELPVYFQAADIAVYPYKEVTTSGALMTAVAYSKAIVATKLPAFQEVLSEVASAQLVAYGDVEGFATALKRLIDDRDQRARVASSVARLNALNSWNAIASKTRQCYSTLLRGKTTRSVAQ